MPRKGRGKQARTSGQEKTQQTESVASKTLSSDQDASADSQPQSKRRRLSKKSSHRTEPKKNCDKTTLDTTSDVNSNLSKVKDQASMVAPMPPHEDKHDQFGKYIGSLLRCLPEEQALQLQFQITERIIQVRLNNESREAGLTTTVHGLD